VVTSAFRHLLPSLAPDRSPVEPRSVVIVGAGLSGLIAAQVLRAGGHDVTVLDKGRSVGGRLATRRIDGATLDHGAQFFTVRGDDFASVVDAAIDAEAVHTWCQGFGPAPDGFPRFAGTGGMNAFAKYLAQGLTTELSCHVDRIAVDDRRWRIETSTGEFRADALVLTPPVPQSLALLDHSAIALPATVADQLGSIDYFATLALLVRTGESVPIGNTGGLQLEAGPFTFIANNETKGISAAPSLTFHAEHDYSERRYDDDPTDVLAELLDLASPWIGTASVLDSQLKKWRYAGPKRPIESATVRCELDDTPLLFAGDAFAGPKVEGAFNSGLAAARSLVTQ